MVNNMEKTLLKHCQKYSHITVQDIIKLIYQNEFAGGHMLSDETDSMDFLQKEYLSLNIDKKTIEFEDIGNGLTRVMLNSKLDENMLRFINKAFVYTSNNRRGNIDRFDKKVLQLKKLSEEGKLDFNIDEINQYMKEYEKTNYEPVSHTEQYRNEYKPHYRVIDVNFKNYLEVFMMIENNFLKKDKLVIGIDGKSGSGKSFFGRLLADFYKGNLFHMDNFFLTPEQKTDERLSIAGGNVDYERFSKEVLENIMLKKDFTYDIYNCFSGKYTESDLIKPANISIVEGVYSHHKFFGNAYDIKIFLDVNGAVQGYRILDRSNEEMLQKFVKEWIPLENYYFSELNIKSDSNVYIDTSKFF